MPRRLTSLSSLGRARICPGSVVLPRIRSRSTSSAVGNGTHEWIDLAASEAIASRGRAPLDDIADRWELWGEARWDFERYVRGLDGCPAPPEALTEVPLALLEDGSVVPVKGGRGEYDTPEGTILAGTIDALWPERDGEVVPFAWDVTPRVLPGAVLALVDWKTGSAEHVPPPRYNWQLKAGALLAARYTGARRVLPMLGLIDGGPVRWDYQERRGFPVLLDERDLAAIETEVRAVAARVAAQDSDRPELVTGAHCSFCPARWACPAHVAAPRAMVQVSAGIAPGGLTHDQAHELLPLLMATRAAEKITDKALRDYVAIHGPIRLPDGREWGPGETTTLLFDTELTFDVVVETLTPLVGEERAREIAYGLFSTTKGALYDAVSEAVDAKNEVCENGEKRVVKKHVMNALLTRLRESGAVTERKGVEFEARWPKELAG